MARERTPRKTAQRSAERPESRAAVKQRTRDALVRAGLELFASRGLDVSLDAICDHAGFTRGAFYVHFADREALLVAVMDHVGEAFLASVFAAVPGEDQRKERRKGAVHTVATRFVDAVKSGSYPLLSAEGGSPMVHMHQLLDACARSPIVRERYRGLVEASIAALGTLVRDDQRAQLLRKDVAHGDVGKVLLAVIIGAQTMGELGVVIDPDRLTRAMLTLLGPAK